MVPQDCIHHMQRLPTPFSLDTDKRHMAKPLLSDLPVPDLIRYPQLVKEWKFILLCVFGEIQQRPNGAWSTLEVCYKELHQRYW